MKALPFVPRHNVATLEYFHLDEDGKGTTILEARLRDGEKLFGARYFEGRAAHKSTVTSSRHHTFLRRTRGNLWSWISSTRGAFAQIVGARPQDGVHQATFVAVKNLNQT